MKEVLDFLKPKKEDIIFIERTGTIVSVYLKGGLKVIKEFPNISAASKGFTIFRKELQDIKVGDG